MKAELHQHGREGEDPPKMWISHKENPLLHRAGFEPGDAIRATNSMFGLVPGEVYPILGYWHRDLEFMYVYVRNTVNGQKNWHRSAMEEKRLQEEVLFQLLPEDITEICLHDYLQNRLKGARKNGIEGLEYLPAYDVEVPMWPEKDNVVPLHDSKGQYLLFNVA